MNEFDDLENRLARMRPADLPSELQARLSNPPARKPTRWLPLAMTLAAVTCVAIVIIRMNSTEPSSPVTSAPQTQFVADTHALPSDFRVFIPISQKSTLVSLENIAVIEPAPTMPVRLVRATWMDHVTYKGDDGHSTFIRKEPRAEIIPIRLETN